MAPAAELGGQRTVGMHRAAARDSRVALRACLSITPEQHLLIDVQDSNLGFANFREVRSGIGEGPLIEPVTRRAISNLIWSARPETRSKTVRAVLTAGVVDP